ncbi:MAG: gamma-glutamyltranspeptidase [marine bacterium B5-7]|nr:MAG: gamma-glutamyltranspeptidase [marine bacterium B5-7]
MTVPEDGEPVTRTGRGAMVASATTEATAAAGAILKAGGNASDAAAACLLMLCVTRIGATCLGGEAPAIVFEQKDGAVSTLSGVGRAPLDPATVEHYRRSTFPEGDIRHAAVPAIVDLCVTLLSRFGSLSFAEISKPVIETLNAGRPTWYFDTVIHAPIDAATGKAVDKDHPDTNPSKRLWWRDLACTLGTLVDSERRQVGNRQRKLSAVSDCFYRGEIADKLCAWYDKSGGILSAADLDAHRTTIEAPVVGEFAGYDIVKCSTWTQGPALLQILKLLEQVDLPASRERPEAYFHLVIEAIKLGLADCLCHYGDPQHVDVPLERLLSVEYARVRATLIDPHSVLLPQPGDPINLKALGAQPMSPSPVDQSTTTCVVRDSIGNMVVITPSGCGSTAGSGGDTGITHGNRLTASSFEAGHPNVIAPGKRPMITPSPTLVLGKGQPVLALSVVGGELQEQVAAQVIIQYVIESLAGQQHTADLLERYHLRNMATISRLYGSKSQSLVTLPPNLPECITALRSLGHRIHANSMSIDKVQGSMIWMDASGDIHGHGRAVYSDHG